MQTKWPVGVLALVLFAMLHSTCGLVEHRSCRVLWHEADKWDAHPEDAATEFGGFEIVAFEKSGRFARVRCVVGRRNGRLSYIYNEGITLWLGEWKIVNQVRVDTTSDLHEAAAGGDLGDGNGAWTVQSGASSIWGQVTSPDVKIFSDYSVSSEKQELVNQLLKESRLGCAFPLRD